MHFILSNYGEKYVGYLLACLHSIKVTNHDAKITVLWQEMDAEKIDALKSFFDDDRPNVALGNHRL